MRAQTSAAGPMPLPDGLRPGGRFEQWRPTAPAYLVADVDGTLVGEGTSATPRVAEAVAAASSSGIAVGFATGRLPAALAGLTDQLDVHGPHVVHNGAEVLVDDRRLAAWPLRRTQVQAVRDVVRRLKTYAEFYTSDGFFVTDWWAPAQPHWDLITGPPDGLIDDVDLNAVEVLRVCPVLFDPGAVQRLVERLRALELTVTPSTSPVIPGMHFVNTTDAAADKGRALAVAAKHLGCPLSAVIAVGDGINDLSMLEVAGTAVAMGQAPQAVRDAAHLVAPEVDADGVAHALEGATAWRRAARSA